MIGRLALVCVMLLCAACPGSDAPAPPRGAPTDTEPPQRGGTLRVTLAAGVDSLDPHGAARPSSWFFARALHRGLLAFPASPHPDGSRPVADLATRAPRARGAFTLRLRRGVRFANGEAITPGDVVASIERLKATGRGIAPYLRDVRVGGLSGRRVRFTGGGPDLPWLLAHPQAAILPTVTKPWGDVAATRIVGAGPYKVESHQLERRIVLVRNDAWEAERDRIRGAYVDQIEARIGVSARSSARSVASGDTDLVVDPGPPDAAIPSIPRGRTAVVSAGCVRYLFLDTDVEPFEDRTIRRAVASAVRRAALPGAGRVSPPAVRMLPPIVTGHRPDPVIREDVGRARTLLRVAGEPRGFRTRLVIADSPRDRAEARAIRNALRRVGIVVRIQTVHPSLVYSDHYEAPGARTPMGLATWCADWPGLAGRSALRPLAASNASRATRYSGLSSRRVNDLLNRARGSASRWAAADEAVTASAAVIPLLWPNEVSVLSGRVRGWSGAPMFPRGDPTTIWLDPAS